MYWWLYTFDFVWSVECTCGAPSPTNSQLILGLILSGVRFLSDKVLTFVVSGHGPLFRFTVLDHDTDKDITN